MLRKTEPKLELTSELDAEGLSRMAPFLVLAREKPTVLAAIVESFNSCEELIIEGDTATATTEESEAKQQLRVVAAMLKHEDDLATIPDPETVTQIHHALLTEQRKLHPRENRIIWLSTVLGQFASFNNYRESIQPQEFRIPGQQLPPPVAESA